MKGLLEDLKHALRLYRRTPISSLLAVLVLGIGMAFVAAFVSLYVDLILRPHPGFERGDPITTFGWNDGRNAGGLPLDTIERIAADAVTIEVAAGVAPNTFQLGPERTQVIGEMVTNQFFPGVRPRLELGRGFEPEEHQVDGEPVVVISHDYWQTQLDGRADVLGTTVQLHPRDQSAGSAIEIVNGQLRTTQNNTEQEPPKPIDLRIVGVMSPHFTGTLPPGQGQISFWIPFELGFPLLQSAANVSGNAPPDMVARMMAQMRTSFTMRGIGRRSPGVDPKTIADELNARFQDILPNVTSRPGMRYDVLDGMVFNANTQRNTQRQLALFLGASVLLAIVAAANVSLFLLARAPGRRRELGIRMSVGAPLKRLARQLTSEAGLLVVAGGAIGLALSVWLAGLLRGLTFWRTAQWRDVTLLDWRVLAIIGTFLGILTVLVSLAPILGLKRLGIAGSGRQIAARATIAQRVAGTVQIAIAGTLAGAAIAFTWYLGSMTFGHPGYDTRNRYVMRFSSGIEALISRAAAQAGSGARIVINSQTINAVVDASRRREAILSLPGVTGVTVTTLVPGGQSGTSSRTFPNPGDPSDNVRIRTGNIDSDYVDVLGLTLLHGRSPSASDVGVVLVNQALAQRLWGRDDVVGEFLPFTTTFTPARLAAGAAPTQPRSEIVGVLENLSYEHPTVDVEPTAFLTSANVSSGMAVIESTQSAAELEKALRGLTESGALEMTINSVTPLRKLQTDVLAADRARSFLTIGTAALVVLLAAFGFYGTQRYLVAAGRREYAIRASLGAGPSALGTLVLKRGLLLGVPGLVLGLPLAFILVAWLRDDYVGRDTSPLAVTVAVAVALVALLTFASFGPMRQARQTQPAPLLRQD